MDFVQCQQPTTDTKTMHIRAGRRAVLPDTYLITSEKNERYVLSMGKTKTNICIWNGMEWIPTPFSQRSYINMNLRKNGKFPPQDLAEMEN